AVRSVTSVWWCHSEESSVRIRGQESRARQNQDGSRATVGVRNRGKYLNAGGSEHAFGHRLFGCDRLQYRVDDGGSVGLGRSDLEFSNRFRALIPRPEGSRVFCRRQIGPRICLQQLRSTARLGRRDKIGNKAARQLQRVVVDVTESGDVLLGELHALAGRGDPET